MASWSTYLQIFAHVALLFFIIPIKIDGPTEIETQFTEYLTKFNKTYNDSHIYQSRFEAFKQSLIVIEALNNNRTNHSAHYGLTNFSDMRPEEFLHTHLQINLSQRIFSKDLSDRNHKRNKRQVLNLPKKVDWRQKNAVTKVRNQKDCGACWAFSAIQTIESMYAIKTGKLESFSVQEMIDCAGYTNNGCEGGDICTLLAWMKDNNVKVQREADYPLLWKTKQCQSNASVSGVQIADFACESFVGSEEFMMELLARNGPVAVAINAKTWQNYIGGVIQYHCDGDLLQLNHAVQIVGYDLTAKIPHYIVRNSWGEDFGDQGYLYIAIKKNICGLANEVSALTVL